MIEAIKYNLSHLTDVSGRDARSTFWWYVLFLVIAQFLIGFLAMIPLMVSGVGSAFDAVQSGSDPDQMQAEMFAGMADAMGTQIYVSAVISVLVMLMLFASFVRRLHDGGFTGYLAIIPFALQLLAISGSIAMVDNMKELFKAASDPAQMQQMQAELTFTWPNIAGWIAFLLVIGFGVMKSQDGANRYGEQPQPVG